MQIRINCHRFYLQLLAFYHFFSISSILIWISHESRAELRLVDTDLLCLTSWEGPCELEFLAILSYHPKAWSSPKTATFCNMISHTQQHATKQDLFKNSITHMFFALFCSSRIQLFSLEEADLWASKLRSPPCTSAVPRGAIDGTLRAASRHARGTWRAARFLESFGLLVVPLWLSWLLLGWFSYLLFAVVLVGGSWLVSVNFHSWTLIVNVNKEDSQGELPTTQVIRVGILRSWYSQHCANTIFITWISSRTTGVMES